jgi:hypothetical protein
MSTKIFRFVAGHIGLSSALVMPRSEQFTLPTWGIYLSIYPKLPGWVGCNALLKVLSEVSMILSSLNSGENIAVTVVRILYEDGTEGEDTSPLF